MEDFTDSVKISRVESISLASASVICCTLQGRRSFSSNPNSRGNLKSSSAERSLSGLVTLPENFCPDLLMYLFMFFVFITAVAVVTLPLNKKRHNPFEAYIREVHPYSGLSPDLYEMFVSGLDLFQETMNPAHLYQALESLEELTMYAKDHDFDESIIKRIGATGERMALVEHPRYF